MYSYEFIRQNTTNAHHQIIKLKPSEMTKEEFIAEIELQKERGGKLLRQVQQMHVGKNNFGDGTAVFGTPSLYFTPKEELEPVEAEYESWKCYVHDFLLSVLDKDDAFISEWDSCLRSPYRRDVSDRDWYSTEIKKALAKLDSFIQRIGFRFKESMTKEETTHHVNDEITKTPAIFISHSSKDKPIITNFVENILLVGMGFTLKDIAYTSEEAFGVEPGENISTYIKENIIGASMVLIMLSDNYRSSEVCLNEMGATWALQKKCVSVLLPGTSFDNLGWLTSLEKAVMINNKTQLSKLCETIAKQCGVEIKDRFTIASQKIDGFIASISTKKQPVPEKFKALKTPNTTDVSREQSMKLFDAQFTGICIEEGDYIIQLNVRLRAEAENVSLRQVFLCNKSEFHGSTYQPLKQMEFKSFVKQGVFELTSDENKAQNFLKEEYQKSSLPIMDLTIEKGHSFSISFVQFFHTIHQMDCYDELQLHGWTLRVLYNVDSEAIIPIELRPVDKDPRGMYSNS